MIDFELENEWSGWSGIAIPDDLDVELSTINTTHQMEISLMKLFELYGYAIHEESCELLVGTGATIEITDGGDEVRFKKYPLDIRTTFDELQESLELLLQQVFSKKNKQDGSNEREGSIQYAEERLQEEGIEYDVNALYHRLMDDQT